MLSLQKTLDENALQQNRKSPDLGQILRFHSTGTPSSRGIIPNALGHRIYLYSYYERVDPMETVVGP